jgi:hypothetical protein
MMDEDAPPCQARAGATATDKSRARIVESLRSTFFTMQTASARGDACAPVAPSIKVQKRLY